MRGSPHAAASERQPNGVHDFHAPTWARHAALLKSNPVTRANLTLMCLIA